MRTCSRKESDEIAKVVFICYWLQTCPATIGRVLREIATVIIFGYIVGGKVIVFEARLKESTGETGSAWRRTSGSVVWIAKQAPTYSISQIICCAG